MVSMGERKAELERLLQEMTERLERLTSDARREYNADSAEQAQERENDEVVDAIGIETRESVAQIRAALQRIEDGSYGECVACGEAISEKRLSARPEATHCINCAD
jgi:RNA polymerase-binding protein DksA